ncbi:MAG: hypothetical protein CVV48_07520 [Spirochaetae bacterium HGW-Spirochaetae-4]|nr:MAG: hypothetical protein A2Y31_06025 [Spirochaetes bacterium GWC2_52_13]PKL21504.1 MAG: hypothetical protein CVV48_07520 [Spirochaetae bacterium HGW-Spirochaetae-4]HCG64117.1 hypothetical protein [Sphaerochaeta sp.]
MKYMKMLLFVMHVVIGVGALGGGYACIVEPLAPLGAPLSMLEGSPFESFLIPGLVLFGLFGIGNIVGAVFLAKKVTWHGYIAGVLGSGMVIWIVIQVLIIDTIAFLHILFFFIGIVEATIGLAMLLQADLFPAPLVRKVALKLFAPSKAAQG